MDIDNKKTINSYGTPMDESEIYPSLISFKRAQIIEKNFIKLFNSDEPNINLHEIDIRPYHDGSVFVDEVIVDEKTLDTFRRNIIRYPERFVDVYESLDYHHNDINGVTGSYIKVEYEPDDNGDGKFKEIIYRHCLDGRELFIRKYTDEELNLMLKESPNHPMIIMMNKTLNKFSPLENVKLPTRQDFESSKNSSESAENAKQLQ